MSYMEGWGSATDQALDLSKTLFTDSNGGRGNIRNIVIVITDGRSTNPAATIVEAQALKDSYTRVFAIGVGEDVLANDAFTTEMHNIASRPSDDHVFHIKFGDLQKIEETLVYRTCKEPAPRKYIRYMCALCG